MAVHLRLVRAGFSRMAALAGGISGLVSCFPGPTIILQRLPALSVRSVGIRILTDTRVHRLQQALRQAPNCAHGATACVTQADAVCFRTSIDVNPPVSPSQSHYHPQPGSGPFSALSRRFAKWFSYVLSCPTSISYM